MLVCNPKSSIVLQDNNSCATNKVSSATEKSSKPLCPVRELIGDVYIWGAPSGAVVTGRTGHGTATDGLQEAWVPTLVNDTFRLDVASVGPTMSSHASTPRPLSAIASRSMRVFCPALPLQRFALCYALCSLRLSATACRMRYLCGSLVGKACSALPVPACPQVSCGPRHAALITKNGETYTWGCGDAGRLGHGDCQSSGYPKMVLELSGRGVTQLACGDWHTAAITRDGSLYTWGDGTAGILGHGNPHRHWSPKRVERPLQGVIFTRVAAGPYHTAAVTRTGTYRPRLPVYARLAPLPGRGWRVWPPTGLSGLRPAIV